MANVLSEEKKQQVLALGRLGWSLRRIQRATGVRRETASEYLKAAGIPVRGRGGAPTGAGPPQTRPPGRGCPPPLAGQNRPPRRRCPPTFPRSFAPRPTRRRRER